jgi:hypothetical protein
MRHCARPGCNAPAVATFTFDGLHRVVWLNPLAEAAAYSAGDLCRRHAERMTPPRNWEMRDTRPPAEEHRVAGTAAPSRFLAPPPPPAPTLPFERPAARRTGAALLARAAHPSVLHPDLHPEATTPLLARAFRNASSSR